MPGLSPYLFTSPAAITGITFSSAFFPTETARMPAEATASATDWFVSCGNCPYITDCDLLFPVAFYHDAVAGLLIKHSYNDRVNIHKYDIISAFAEQLAYK